METVFDFSLYLHAENIWKKLIEKFDNKWAEKKLSRLLNLFNKTWYQFYTGVY